LLSSEIKLEKNIYIKIKSIYRYEKEKKEQRERKFIYSKEYI